MTCRDLTGFLADYLEGELPLATKAAFEGHLEACPACRRYLQSYRAVIRLGKDVAAEDELPEDDLPEDLVAAILSACRPA